MFSNGNLTSRSSSQHSKTSILLLKVVPRWKSARFRWIWDTYAYLMPRPSGLDNIGKISIWRILVASKCSIYDVKNPISLIFRDTSYYICWTWNFSNDLILWKQKCLSLDQQYPGHLQDHYGDVGMIFFITETYWTTSVSKFFHLINFWFDPTDALVEVPCRPLGVGGWFQGDLFHHWSICRNIYLYPLLIGRS